MKLVFIALSEIINGYIYESEVYSLALEMIREFIDTAKIDVKGNLPVDFKYDISYESFARTKHLLLKLNLISLERGEGHEARTMKWTLSSKGHDIMLKLITDET